MNYKSPKIIGASICVAIGIFILVRDLTYGPPISMVNYKYYMNPFFRIFVLLLLAGFGAVIGMVYEKSQLKK